MTPPTTRCYMPFPSSSDIEAADPRTHYAIWLTYPAAKLEGMLRAQRRMGEAADWKYDLPMHRLMHEAYQEVLKREEASR